MTSQAPRFRELDAGEIQALLARNHVGRLAWMVEGRVDIEPLHYVYHDGWLYGRTSHGAKLEATGYEWSPVAFEVDEVEGLFRWRSAVVHGGFYVLSEEGADWEEEAWRRGVELLRGLVPGTFTANDPTAFRTVVFRIAVQDVTGREATPGHSSADATGEP